MSGGRRDAVQILTRAGCHLCEMVESHLRSSVGGGVLIRPVDIDSDPELSDEYSLRIPVVMVGGRVVFEARMIDQEGEWRTTLSRLCGA